jgi:hypothetical protein
VCILLVNGLLPRLGVHGCLREVHRGEAPRIHRTGVSRRSGQRVIWLEKERPRPLEIQTYGANARED